MTAVNESLWEVKNITVILTSHQKKFKTIQADLLRELDAIKVLFFLFDSETIYELINYELDWLEQRTTDLEIGLAILAKGRFPPQLFPATQLSKVIQQVLLKTREKTLDEVIRKSNQDNVLNESIELHEKCEVEI
jgi:hypothetical protein